MASRVLWIMNGSDAQTKLVRLGEFVFSEHSNLSSGMYTAIVRGGGGRKGWMDGWMDGWVTGNYKMMMMMNTSDYFEN